jgi:plasmid stabilization system protein ParE
VPELEGADFREVIYRRYRIIYLYDEEADAVEVLAIVHASQRLGSSL